MKNLSSWPEKIYLQIDEDSGELPPMNECSLEDVTWCADSVMSCEVAYVRADLIHEINERTNHETTRPSIVHTPDMGRRRF